MQRIKWYVYVIVGLVIGFLLCRVGCTPKPVTNEVTTVDTLTIRDTIRYPEQVRIPVPVTKWKTKTVYVGNDKDSLAAYYRAQLDSCSWAYTSALSEILAARPGDTVFIPQLEREYIDSFIGENYSLRWRIGTSGELLYYQPEVEVRSTNTKTAPEKPKYNAIGLSVGGYADTKSSLGYAIGLNFEKKLARYSLQVLPRQKAVLFSTGITIKRW